MDQKSSLPVSPTVPTTFGSPVSKTLNPFTSSDLLQSFVSGLAWGGAAILLLAIGAWLVAVMRKRVYFTSNPATTQNPAVIRNTRANPELSMSQRRVDNEENLHTYLQFPETN